MVARGGRRRDHLLARLVKLLDVAVVPSPQAPYILLRVPTGQRYAVRQQGTSDAFVVALAKRLVTGRARGRSRPVGA